MTKRQQLLRLLENLPESEPGNLSMSSTSEVGMFTGTMPNGRRVSRGYVVTEGNEMVACGDFDDVKNKIENEIFMYREFKRVCDQ